MRITIGHLLIFFLLGGGATVGVLNSAGDGMGVKVAGAVASIKGLFSGGTVEADIPPQALPADSPLISTTTEAPATESAPANVIPAAPEPEDARQKIPEGALTIDETIPDPEPAPVVEEKPAPAPPPKRARRKRTAAVKTAASAPSAAAPRRKRTARAKVDALVGTYVTLTLKSGREVKGVLESKTSTAYMIQLPGMGPFEYKAADVVSVKAVD